MLVRATIYLPAYETAGAAYAPAFPAPSDFEGNEFAQLGRNMPRGLEGVSVSRQLRSPDERRDIRELLSHRPGCRFAHPGYKNFRRPCERRDPYRVIH
jgi:hypothetical protein